MCIYINYELRSLSRVAARTRVRDGGNLVRVLAPAKFEVIGGTQRQLMWDLVVVEAVIELGPRPQPPLRYVLGGKVVEPVHEEP